jgi:predicted enzyme related to lactoylglutathione lyase
MLEPPFLIPLREPKTTLPLQLQAHAHRVRTRGEARFLSAVVYRGAMITAVHNLIYSEDAEATRVFFRDVLGWPNVDAGGGWLIYKTGPSELGVHPSSGEHNGEAWSTHQHHEISLVCDDIEQTVSEWTKRGVRFTREIQDAGFGRTTSFEVPGAGEMLVYEPKHPTAYGL